MKPKVSKGVGIKKRLKTKVSNAQQATLNLLANADQALKPEPVLSDLKENMVTLDFKGNENKDLMNLKSYAGT